MKKIKSLFFITFLLFSLVFIQPPVRAYEQDQLADCISSAKANPSIKGVSDSSIENYCDCALALIVDQSKNIRESGVECAIKNFG